jgi:hypothetical protein
MNRIASITTLLAIVVLLLAGPARAQYNDQKLTATIPFEFVVGKSIFPAGQYVFLRTGANTLQIRNEQGRSLVTVVTGPVEATQASSNTRLRFVNIAGSHVLVQVWNKRDGIGSELYNAHSLVEEARYPAIHGTIAGRR